MLYFFSYSFKKITHFEIFILEGKNVIQIQTVSLEFDIKIYYAFKKIWQPQQASFTKIVSKHAWY